MGLNIGFSSSKSSCCGNVQPDTRIDNPNPDPKKFDILNVTKGYNKYFMYVNYPNCKNFEGNKILVFTGQYDPKKFEGKNAELDPHFCEHNDLIARFRPTREGIDCALQLIGSIK